MNETLDPGERTTVDREVRDLVDETINPVDGPPRRLHDPEVLRCLGLDTRDRGAGRFLRLRPLGLDASDANLYRYVKNRPTKATDPRGLDTISDADIKAAEKELTEKKITGREFELRIAILKTIKSRKFEYPDESTKYQPIWPTSLWEESWVPKKGIDLVEAIKGTYRTDEAKIWCKSLSTIIIVKANIDLAEKNNTMKELKSAIGKWNDNYNPFYESKQLPAKVQAWTLDQLLPGDQIWFQNPYANFYDKDYNGKKWGGPYTGEEGSNTFYIGNGKTVSIYSQLVTTVEKKQESMLQWRSVVDAIQDVKDGKPGYDKLPPADEGLSLKKGLFPWHGQPSPEVFRIQGRRVPKIVTGD